MTPLSAAYTMKSTAATAGAILWMATDSAKTRTISATAQPITVPGVSWKDPEATEFATIQAITPETARPAAIQPYTKL